jgi:hypothetical protein
MLIRSIQVLLLEIRLGQMSCSGNSGVELDGKLLVSGGTLDMSGGDNYIEYTASGNSELRDYCWFPDCRLTTQTRYSFNHWYSEVYSVWRYGSVWRKYCSGY